jgi:hypothetical protein
MDLIQEMTKSRATKYGTPDPLFTSISNCLRSISSGTVTIHIENQSFLKLVMTQSGTEKIKLEFGQKFLEMSLAIGLNRLFDTS